MTDGQKDIYITYSKARDKGGIRWVNDTRSKHIKCLCNHFYFTNLRTNRTQIYNQTMATALKLDSTGSEA